MKRIILAFKLAWFGFTHPEMLSETIFVNMAKLLEIAFKVCNDEKPYTTHLFLDKKRIVSFWMYPGLTKNPVDRITELIAEIEGLKDVAQQHITGAGQP